MDKYTQYFPKGVILTAEEESHNTFGGDGDDNLFPSASIELKIERWKSAPETRLSIAAGYGCHAEFERVGEKGYDFYLTELKMPLPKYSLAQILDNIRDGKAIPEKDVPLGRHFYVCVIGQNFPFHARVDNVLCSPEFSPEKIIQTVGDHYRFMGGWGRHFHSDVANWTLHRERLSSELLKLCKSYGMRDEYAAKREEVTLATPTL
ncbi:MAG: hypothetical protein WCV90_00105 [Candidatus Woesearchaeota archaeon]